MENKTNDQIIDTGVEEMTNEPVITAEEIYEKCYHEDTDEAAKEFERLFPGISLESVTQDECFKLFSNSSLEKLPSRYRNYLKLVDIIQKRANQRALTLLASKNSSVGSLSSSSSGEIDFFTKEQVLKMSQEEIRKNFTKIRQSQQKW